MRIFKIIDTKNNQTAYICVDNEEHIQQALKDKSLIEISVDEFIVLIKKPK
jgi:hypothetical protein